MATDWTYDEDDHEYRDDGDTVLTAAALIALRTAYMAFRGGVMSTFLAATLGGVDTTDAQAWQAAVARTRSYGWRRIENSLIASYMAGRGGIHAMTAADRITLQGLVNEQRRYWIGFMREAAADPDMSIAYITNRANLYTKQAWRFWERGRASAYGLVLPTYPGEQQCLSSCGCVWQFEEDPSEVRVSWVRGKADGCPDCVRNERQYNPLVFPKPTPVEVMDDEEDDA